MEKEGDDMLDGEKYYGEEFQLSNIRCLFNQLNYPAARLVNFCNNYLILTPVSKCELSESLTLDYYHYECYMFSANYQMTEC